MTLVCMGQAGSIFWTALGKEVHRRQVCHLECSQVWLGKGGNQGQLPPVLRRVHICWLLIDSEVENEPSLGGDPLGTCT
jgi:hypothetical protein